MTAPTRKPPVRNDSGFTLVEVLVGLALLALLTAVLGTAVGGLRQTQRVQDRRTAEVSVEPIAAYLRRTLAAMQTIRLTPGPASAPLIEARADQLTFITGHAPAGDYAGLYRIQWKLVESPLPGRFDLEETRVLHRPVPTTEGEIRTRLLTGLTSLTFRYYGERTGRADWGDAWSAAQQLPALVGVDITFAPGDPRRWPELIVGVPTGR